MEQSLGLFGARRIIVRASAPRGVNGHEFLPMGGHGTCPLVAMVSARWRPRNCPRVVM